MAHPFSLKLRGRTNVLPDIFPSGAKLCRQVPALYRYCYIPITAMSACIHELPHYNKRIRAWGATLPAAQDTYTSQGCSSREFAIWIAKSRRLCAAAVIIKGRSKAAISRLGSVSNRRGRTARRARDEGPTWSSRSAIDWNWNCDRSFISRFTVALFSLFFLFFLIRLLYYESELCNLK